ncbi:MAG: glycosyltransferase family 9 protein [Ignavibacteriaceae bacterium]
MFVILKNLANFLVYLIIDFLICLKKVPVSDNTLLLIRLDSIGDYVLFRNFIEIVRTSNIYKNYKITLCGNIIWKNLAETFDSSFVDEFIWIDRKKFYGNPFYKYSVLKKIHAAGFETVIDPTYTREILFGDSIVKTSCAKERIGCTASLDKHAKWKRNILSDDYYTRLLKSDTKNLFEFYRNKEFFENLFQIKLQIQKPYFDTTPIKLDKIAQDKYVIIVPGANDRKRIWKAGSFVSVAEYILKEFNINIIITGSQSESVTAQFISSKLNSTKVHDLAGKISLPSLVKYIEDAELIISNETSSVHIATAVNTSFICISNGNHLGRFNPYPQEIFANSFYIYPPQIKEEISNFDNEENKFRFNSELNINDITPGEVINVIKKLLSR